MWLLTPALLSGQIEYIYVNDYKLVSVPWFYELKKCSDARGVIMSVKNCMHRQIALLQTSKLPSKCRWKWNGRWNFRGWREEWSVIPSRLTVMPVWLVIWIHGAPPPPPAAPAQGRLVSLEFLSWSNHLYINHQNNSNLSHRSSSSSYRLQLNIPPFLGTTYRGSCLPSSALWVL